MSRRIVFFDLETGGLEAGRHPITQFAAVAVDASTFCEIEALELKLHFDPDAADPGALELNSFDPDVWMRDAVPPGKAEVMISAFLRRHATIDMVSKRGKPYQVAQLAGHNAATFDFPFLATWYRARDAFLAASFSVLDTLQLARWHFFARPEAVPPKSNRLADLAAALGVELQDAHDALGDVRATAAVCRKLLAEQNAKEVRACT